MSISTSISTSDSNLYAYLSLDTYICIHMSVCVYIYNMSLSLALTLSPSLPLASPTYPRPSSPSCNDRIQPPAATSNSAAGTSVWPPRLRFCGRPWSLFGPTWCEAGPWQTHKHEDHSSQPPFALGVQAGAGSSRSGRAQAEASSCGRWLSGTAAIRETMMYCSKPAVVMYAYVDTYAMYVYRCMYTCICIYRVYVFSVYCHVIKMRISRNQNLDIMETYMQHVHASIHNKLLLALINAQVNRPASHTSTGMEVR